MIRLSFIILFAVASATDLESVRISFSQKALDFGEEISEILFNVIKEEAPGRLDLPNIDGDKFKLKNLQLQSLDLRKPTVSTAPLLGLMLNNPAGLQITGDWSVKAGWWWIHGSLDLDVDMVVSAVTGILESNGRFSTKTVGCSVTFEDFDLDLHNGFITWVVGLMKGKIKSEIETSVCKEMEGVLQTTANQMLASLPQVIPVSNIFDVHIEADETPNFGLDHINIPGRVTITSQGSLDNFPFYPQPMIHTMDVSYMTCLLLSDYTVNTGTYTNFPAGRIDYEVPNEDIDSSNRVFNTSYFQTILPELYTQYPDQVLSLRIVNIRYPFVEFIQDEVTINMPVDVFVKVSGQNVLGLSVNLTINSSLKHDNNVISGEILDTKQTTSLMNTTLPGEITSEEISSVVDEVLSQTLLPEVNMVLGQGLSLPVHEYVTISKGLLQAHDDFLRVCADISLTDDGIEALKKMAKELLD